MDANGISVERWRAMSHAERCEAFLQMAPQRAEMVTRFLLENLDGPREWAELFVAASHWGQVADTPCTVDRVIALANYLREDGGEDAVLEPVRIAAWHADGQLPAIGRSKPARRVELACEILSAYAMVDAASKAGNHRPTKDDAPPEGAPSGRELPDLIAWMQRGRNRVFPTSQAGVAALMACPTFARYGVPLLHLGVDITHTHLDSLSQAGLHVGCCQGDDVRDAVAAVVAWGATGRQAWLPY